jgi:hypothetical protein
MWGKKAKGSFVRDLLWLRSNCLSPTEKSSQAAAALRVLALSIIKLNTKQPSSFSIINCRASALGPILNALKLIALLL